MSRGFDRFLTPAFTAQASAAIASGGFSAGAQTDYNTLAGENLDGCSSASIEIDVTVFAAAGACQIWHEAKQHDDTGYAEPRLVGRATIAGAGKHTEIIHGLGRKGRIKLKAIDQNITASASMLGMYTADV